MNTTTIIIIVAVVLVLGILVSSMSSRSNKAKQHHNQEQPEYDLTVETMGGEKEAQAELDKRQKHVDELKINPLSDTANERYTADWAAIQSKFVDGPGQAVKDAEKLTIEVMQARGYPVSDFDQRAADISIQYPEIVTNYRAAREISVKNDQKLANTEELRQAILYYRALFEDLLKAEAKKK
jgi:hypothetical protein